MATQIHDIAASLTNTPPDIHGILRQMPLGVVVAQAPGGRIVSANARAEELYRGPIPDAQSVDEYGDYFVGFRPDGSQYEADEWPLARALLHGEVVHNEEIEVRLPSGERRLLQVSAAPVRAGTRVTHAVALFDDVTEERQDERRREFLMELSDRLRLLDDPVSIMEAASVSTGEYLGVSSVSYAELDAKGRHAVVPAEYRNGRVAPPGRYYLEDFGTPLLERIRRGETVAVEEASSDAVIATDVFDMWGICSLVSVPIMQRGELAAIFTVMHSAPRHWARSDIALVEQVAERTWHAVEAARVQTELRQSREWLTLALGAGSAAVWEWDLRTGHIHWSEENASVLGVTSGRRSLRFERWLALVHPDDRAAAKTASRRIAAMREGEIEFEHRVAGPGERWIAMRGRILADPRGLPHRVVGIAVDTTERKAAELERERLLQQAREASEAKSHFISVISHEFRTPLTAIIGYTDLLSTGVAGELSPRQARQLDRIRTSAWHLTHMVDEILAFSRIEAGVETVSPEPTEVVSLTRETVALVAPGVAAKELALACELPDGAIVISTDGGKLRQVLLNLLGNAIKFTEKGGVTMRLRQVDGAVEFTVRDTGIGIAPEHRERVFERFWQVDQDTRHVSGAGLGLTVSRRLVELLGGELQLDSEVGVGSTFTFTLPLGV